ncbi:PepSY-associated TM helix domain-containing protein [Prosthecomicrobium pneumaticum]|uniref:Putative iron-regulated membrane protein n=1 Tax=Prosthecomicrobium pneumaticum TaxID=81895 RepID=A0A7W9FJB3_9HYPH|nr:PepSY domain-containing protein [Prosthecomicrobium pneumaticum]MBB5751345.1 putative iron-regulated membrane protein [Prosthecomicrobium pneumaticum]
MSTITQPAADAAASTRLYRAVWRWHFYAGLYVVPFLVMLVLTGLVMMIYSDRSNELGWVPDVAVGGGLRPVSAQADAALAAVPGGRLTTYVAPQRADRPAFFQIESDQGSFAVAVDPYRGAVVATTDLGRTVRAIAEKIHGTLLIGDVGDRLIEVAASLSIVLVVTGLYLWWPRGSVGVARALFPNLALKGRAFWKDLHKSLGVWTAAFLLLFMLSGLAWTGVWGDRFAKPWSGFPAEKWDNVPLSDVTHAALDHGLPKEEPWALDATPMPASGSTAGAPGVGTPVSLDSVTAWAARNGFTGQYKLSLPMSETGVYTVAYDGRNQDSALPSSDRFVHIDRYTGNILADIRFADYSPLGKLMAWGIALHKGMAGPINFVFNLVYLAFVLLLCISGIAMWWKRRPAGAVGAPRYAKDFRLSAGVSTIAVALGVLFPLGGLAILAFAVIDALLPKRLKEAGWRPA